jgi:hypothetical protein
MPCPPAAALQRSLNKMVGQSSGFLEALPAPVRTRIQYLAELDGERAELYERYRRVALHHRAPAGFLGGAG